MTGDELQEMLHEREWRKCAPNWDTSTLEEKVEAFEYWCAKYVYIRFPGKGKIKFELRDAQRDSVRMWLGNRYTLALKARQIGFSTLISLFTFWCAFFYNDRTIIMLSKTERDSQNLLSHARYAARYLPQWMLHRGPLIEANMQKVKFSNESVIESLPSASDPARGKTAFIIVVDELGQLPNSEEAWAAIEPVAVMGGSVHMLGTANGEGNLFHKLWQGADGTWVDKDGTIKQEGTGDNRFKSMFYGWWNGGHSDEWFEGQCRDMPEWQRAQEYPENPTEAFLKSGRPVFDLSVLQNIDPVDPVKGWLDMDTAGNFVPDRVGPLSLWEPPKEGEKYTIGVDVAEGLEYGDYSSIHVIKAKTGEVVAHWHGHIDPDLLGTDVCVALGQWYNKALILVESNNHGLTTLTALKRANYFPLFYQKRLGTRDAGSTEAMGWRTTAKSKPFAVDELNKALRDGSCVLYDRATIAELRTYVRDEKGRMHGSPHDDRVMSLAIAVQGLTYVYHRQFQPAPEGPKIGSIEWHVSLISPNKEPEQEDLVGSYAVA